MYRRFELFVDDEDQGIGFLQGICELDKSDDFLDSLTEIFDKYLEIPQSVFVKHRYTKSWFTELGYEIFKEAINKIEEEYENTGLFNVQCLCSESLEDIVYEDEYQIICKA